MSFALDILSSATLSP